MGVILSDIKVREAKKKDIKTITKYYKRLYEGDEKEPFYNSKLRIGKISAGQRLIVASSENKIMGFVWIVWYEHIKNKGVMYIEELYVDNSFRRRGIGKKLINEAIEIAKEKKISSIFVTTGEHLKAAKKFYKKINFRNMPKTCWFVKELK